MTAWDERRTATQLKVFVLPLRSLVTAEAELKSYFRPQLGLVALKEFAPDWENAFSSFYVECLEGTPTAGMRQGSKAPKVDHKQVHKPVVFKMVSRRREWCKVVAENDKVPVYSVLTKEHLAQLVQKRLSTKACLKEFEGVAEARLEKCGDDMLERLEFNSVHG